MQFDIACVDDPLFVATNLNDWIEDVDAAKLTELDFVEPMTTTIFTAVDDDPVLGKGTRFAPVLPPPPPPHAESNIVARVIESVITALFDFCLITFTALE